MVDQIINWLRPPVFTGDEDKTYRAALFNAATLTILVLMVLTFFSNVFSRSFPDLILYADLLTLGATLALRSLIKQGRILLAAVGMAALGLSLVITDLASLGAIRPPITVIFFLVIIVAGLMADHRGLAAITVVSSLAILCLLLIENAWQFPLPGSNMNITQWITYSALFGLAGGLTFLAHQSTRHGIIRERKMVEGLLRVSKTNFSTFFDSIDDMLFVLDMDGTILKANATVCQRLDYTEDELIGQSILMVHPPERRLEAGAIVAEMLAGKRKECPIPVMTRQGNLIEVETRITSGKWNGQDALFGVTKDVSALKRSEEKFYKAFSMSPTPMAISTFEEGRYVNVNKAFCAILGYEKEEVIGKTSVELIIFAETSQRDDLLKDIEHRGFLRNTECKVRRHDGSVLEGLFSAESIDLGGNPHLLSTFTDISERKQLESELQSQNDFMMQVVNNMGQGLTVTDAESRFEFVNPAYAKLFGYTPQDLVGKSPSDLTASTDQAGLAEARAARLQGKVSTYESNLVRADGTIAPVLVTGAPRWKNGKVAGAIAVITDLSEIKRAQEAVRESETKYRIVAENTYDWEFWADTHGKFTYVSPSCQRISGYNAEAFKTDPGLLGRIVHPDDLARFMAHQENSKKRQKDEIEYRIIHADGSVRWISHICFPIFDEGGQYLGQRGSNRDITIRREMEDKLSAANRRLQSQLKRLNKLQEQLREQAIRDPLTHLYNRRFLDDILPRELDRAKRDGYEIGVLMIDIDFFKRINDLYGHDAGDEALRAIARLLQNKVRASDVVCRYGGEEIICLLTKTNRRHILKRAEELRLAIAGMQPIEAYPDVRLAVSIGATIIHPETVDTVSWLKTADEALYQAKSSGRNCVCILP